MALKNVIIIGASGNLGPFILSALDTDSELNISILSRQSSRATFASHIKIYQVSDDYPEEGLVSAFKDQDAIINMAPITEVALHKKIIDAALKAGVKRIILSEFGTNVPELQTTKPVPIYQGKIEIRDYMKSKEGQDLTWTGLVVGAFFDWGLEDGFIGFDLKTKTATIFDSGDTPTEFTLLSTVGKATKAILAKSVETADRYVFINSFRATQKEVLEALEKATETKWKVKKTTCEEESRIGKEKMEKGDWSGVGHAIMGASYSGGKYDFALGRQLDNALLGLPTGESLNAIVAKIVKG
ncbi:hypothetical protein P7C71_g6435, partial [Lecanoromycetidae sp. Uapishka_2]